MPGEPAVVDRLDGWTCPTAPNNPVHDFRRRFVILQIQVKFRYKLSVTESEAAAMLGVLSA